MAFLDWLEKRRVFIGTVLALCLLVVGGVLAWIDWHPPKTELTTSRTLIKESVTKVEAQTVNEQQKEVVPNSAAKQGVVNINTAGATELDTLPGIGPTYAKRIIEYREQHGSFKTVGDIVKVNGIGDATYQKIAASITVGGN